MNVERLVVGQLATNCYLAFCPKVREAVIIDPGDDGDFVIRKALDLNLKPKFILATHGHFDHLLSAKELQVNFKIPFLIHRADLFLLKRVKSTADYFLDFKGFPELAEGPPRVERYLEEGEIISFGKEQLKILETPGHTPGGVSFYTEGALFSGDTLFCRGVGRTDLSYSSFKALQDSLQKLFRLPPRTVVYPGHGEETNLAAERALFSRFG
jgi:glyoxylase-like metal-dependent hydrolase (beta-lactamase superfamily II)